jgi:hypothetical protein
MVDQQVASANGATGLAEDDCRHEVRPTEDLVHDHPTAGQLVVVNVHPS